MRLSKKSRLLLGDPPPQGDDGFRSPDPTRQDTARLANATQAQIAELIAQGYLPYDSSPVRNTRQNTKSSFADRGLFADNEVSVSEIEKGIVSKPWMASEIIKLRDIDGYDFSSGFAEDVLNSVKDFLNNTIPGNDHIENDRAKLISKVGSLDVLLNGSEATEEVVLKELREILYDVSQNIRSYTPKSKRKEGVYYGRHAFGQNDAMNAARADYDLYRKKESSILASRDKFNEGRIDLEDGRRVVPIQDQGAFLEGLSGDYYADTGDYNSSRAPISVAALSVANPGAIDYDEYVGLVGRGYGNNNPTFFEPTYALSSDRLAAQARNFGRNVYNVFFGDEDTSETIDRGDLGTQTITTRGDRVTLEEVPGGKISGFKNIYPDLRYETRVEEDNVFPFTDQREFLRDGFFLDREAAGTGAVRRDDLQKTLFNQQIKPGRKLEFYNEDFKDIVEVFSYDTPEFMDVIGGESLFETTPEDEPEVDPDDPVGRNERPDPIAPMPTLPLKLIKTLKDRELKGIGDSDEYNRQIQTGRRPIQLGALAQSYKGSRQGGQRLEREYYWDPVKRQYKEREVDPERKGGPVYGGKYAFKLGGKINLKKKPQEGMRLKKANQGMIIGDPKKHQEKVRALGRNNETIYVPAGEGAMEDPENYLNLSRLDSIIDSSYSGDLPFSNFRDQVRKVEAGPDAKSPYTMIQRVNVYDDDGRVIGTEPVRKEKQPGYGSGAYQLDHATAITAYNRLKSIADKRDMDYPMLTDNDLKYPSSLPPEIQDMLFTAHFAKDKASSVKKVKSDKSSWADQWYAGHYKGEDEERRTHFKSLQ